jgi:hypothetical protein
LAESVTVRIDVETKMNLEKLKEKVRFSTHSDGVEKLIKYYLENERKKQLDYEEKQAEKERHKKETLDVGEELKKRYIDFGNNLGFRIESEKALHILLEHYKNSDSIRKETLQEILRLQR